MSRNVDLKKPQLLINRELSWVEFNDRVLKEGFNEELPLGERLKFLSIVSSNLDEYFMIRVAGLRQQRASDPRKQDQSGLTAGQQLDFISKRVHTMVAEQTGAIKSILNKLTKEGFSILQRTDWSEQQAQYLHRYFTDEILPVLTPMAVEELKPSPLLPGLQLFVAFTVASRKSKTSIIVVPVPGLLQRFINIPTEGDIYVAPVEDVIAANAQVLFGDDYIVSADFFRITRDADIEIQQDEAADLLSTIAKAVKERRRRAAVRLEITAGADNKLIKWLTRFLRLSPEDIYEIDGLLDASALFKLIDLMPSEKLKVRDWSPQPPRDLMESDNIWNTIQERDVMLFLPYESFDPVIKLSAEAANDPNVLAIKQTLYRTSGGSPIVRSLINAARNGKEVTVLVELKARFDETRNVSWARELEDAGCHVIYGVAELKTHAKAMLVVRREKDRIRRYAHLATGNYNDRTAKLYSDVGLMTCDADITADVSAFFNLLTGRSETVGWKQLTIAPTDLRQKLIDLIEREIRTATAGDKGLIMAKLNAIEDPAICRALYRASRAGVKIMLNIRGMCCLRPGVKGISDNIEVRSIIDRYLEHSRIFYFHNGGNDEIYLSSADWMHRNLDRRLEILFPVKNSGIKARLLNIMKTFFADNTNSWQLMSGGTYKRVISRGKKVRAQEKFHLDSVAAASEARHKKTRFQPLSRPEK